jgi:hypothetical protein
MLTIIAGSRDIQGSEAERLIKAAIEACGFKGEITGILHGNCRGIDKTAGSLLADSWPIYSLSADWDKHGKSAGPIRNYKMAKMAQALIAIWDGKSRGTANMIQMAEKEGLKVYVYRTDKEQP